MRVSDETLYEGVTADLIPDGSDALQASFDIARGLVMIVIWMLTALVLLFVPSRSRRSRHRA